MARTKKTVLDDARQKRREIAEADLASFIELIHPLRLLGNIHREIISWWMSSNSSRYQMLLLPRDHMKSALIAYRAAWRLTKDPTLKILYISSTSNLATKQLKFIKDILTSDTYRLYWPEMVNKEEQKREKWTEREISVDDPRRAAEAIRDPSIFTAGLTTNIIGMHCDIAILDDVVVANNAYTGDNREKVLDQYGLLSSVEATNAEEWVVGTRYHPLDLYGNLLERTVEIFDDEGQVVGSEHLFDVKQWAVETAGDGTGQFIWPRQQRFDGKWFGFDQKILADKRTKYLNRVHFRAQYYNDPRDLDNSPIKRELFQYYDTNYMSCRDGKWFYKNERLNVFAAVDFAYTTGKKSDYTSIVVVGCDGSLNYYILEIDRFKTDKISEYFSRILSLYQKWGFRKIRAETSAAQSVIVKDLKDNYIRPYGLSLTMEDYRPSRIEGAKEERIMAVLEPRYTNGQMWHYIGGNCQALEEELMFASPAHDDIKDALASCVDFSVAPMNYFNLKKDAVANFNFHARFGGVV